MDDILVIKKIQKLLALSKSSNEYEAEVALTKAHKLLREYNLSQDDIERSQSKVYSISIQAFTRERAWKSVLINAIAEYNYCKVLKVQSSDIIVDKQKKKVYSYQVFGREIDVAVCKEMFDYLFKTVLFLAGNFALLETEYTHKESFKIGMACRLSERLLTLAQQEIQQYETPGTSLIVAYRSSREAEIAKHWKAVGFEIEWKKGDGPSIYKNSFSAGYNRADSVSLARQISS